MVKKEVNDAGTSIVKERSVLKKEIKEEPMEATTRSRRLTKKSSVPQEDPKTAAKTETKQEPQDPRKVVVKKEIKKESEDPQKVVVKKEIKKESKDPQKVV